MSFVVAHSSSLNLDPMGKGVAKREDKVWKKQQKAEKRKKALGKVVAADSSTTSKASDHHAKVAKATGGYSRLDSACS